MASTDTTPRRPELPTPTVNGNGDVFPYLFVRTRTGKRVHLGGAGWAGTACGVWLRTNGQNMAIRPEQVEAVHVCGNCFPSFAPSATQEA